MDSNEKSNENKNVNSKSENNDADKNNEMAKQEQPDAFAQGLPDWSIEPPQVVVRRKIRK